MTWPHFDVTIRLLVFDVSVNPPKTDDSDAAVTQIGFTHTHVVEDGAQ